MGDWVFYFVSTNQLACAGQEEMLNVIYFFGLFLRKNEKMKRKKNFYFCCGLIVKVLLETFFLKIVNIRFVVIEET